MTVEVECGDRVYELDVSSVHFETRPTWDDPGDGGEIEFGNFVTYCVEGSHTRHVTTYDVFLLDFAADRDLDLDDADRAVHDMGYEQVVDAYDDRD